MILPSKLDTARKPVDPGNGLKCFLFTDTGVMVRHSLKVYEVEEKEYVIRRQIHPGA
jgi:hypothetical protein